MKKEIRFGECQALFDAVEHRASLTINGTALPTLLADAINEIGDIDINEIRREDSCSTVIDMSYDITTGEVFDKVCEAISKVYDVDTVISNA